VKLVYIFIIAYFYSNVGLAFDIVNTPLSQVPWPVWNCGNLLDGKLKNKIAQAQNAAARDIPGVSAQGLQAAMARYSAKFLVLLEEPALTQDIARLDGILSFSLHNLPNFVKLNDEITAFIEQVKKRFADHDASYFKLKEAIAKLTEDSPFEELRDLLRQLDELDHDYGNFLYSLRSACQQKVENAIIEKAKPRGTGSTVEEARQMVRGVFDAKTPFLVSAYSYRLIAGVLGDKITDVKTLLSWRVIGKIDDIRVGRGKSLVSVAHSEEMKELLRKYGGH